VNCLVFVCEVRPVLPQSAMFFFCFCLENFFLLLGGFDFEFDFCVYGCLQLYRQAAVVRVVGKWWCAVDGAGIACYGCCARSGSTRLLVRAYAHALPFIRSVRSSISLSRTRFPSVGIPSRIQMSALAPCASRRRSTDFHGSHSGK
jgi:hypothetical protein